MLESRSSEKKLVKPLKKFLGAQFAQKRGHHWPRLNNRNNKSRSSAFFLRFTPYKAEQPIQTTKHGVTRKEAQKRL